MSVVLFKCTFVSSSTFKSSRERKSLLRRTWHGSSQCPFSSIFKYLFFIIIIIGDSLVHWLSIGFREDHPDLIEERKKSDLPEKPKTPQQLWYNHEKKTYMKIHPEVKEFGRGKLPSGHMLSCFG